MDASYYIGIDIGATLIKLGIVTRDGQIVSKDSVETAKIDGPSHFVRSTGGAIERMLKNTQIEKKLVGALGVGAPGWVDHRKRIVHELTNIPDWKEVELARELEQEIGPECFVDNDVNVMAIGELVYGAGRGRKDFVCLTLGTGVGGAVIINGEIYRGTHGLAGEVGHLTLDMEGVECMCGGAGCLESHVGNHFIVAHALERIKAENDGRRGSILLEMANNRRESITTKLLAEAAQQGDEIALEVWQAAGRHLGTALAGLVNLLNPECFIIGGGVAKAGTVLFDPMRKTMESLAMNELGYSTPIVEAELGEDAGIIGAATFAMLSSKEN